MVTEDATRRAQDTSEAGRHVALIALDGACEYALWLATRAHGLAFKNDRVPLGELHSSLKGALGDRWQVRGWTSVSQLHRARNEAQHAAVVPDAGQLPLWRDAAWAFIDSVCRAAFGISLDAIVLADAVRDPQLRARLAESEQVLGEEPSRSLALTLQAFDQGRESWRLQRRPERFVPLAGTPLPSANPTADLGKQFRELDEFLEVELFAGDGGEYVWLRRAREEHESVGWIPSYEEARRALLFVTSWIVRWESFVVGYPADSWERHREGIQPPTWGDGLTPEIIGAHTEFLPEVSGRQARCILHLRLANAPDRGRWPWQVRLQEGLTDAAAEAGDPAMFTQVQWTYAGDLRLHVDLHTDPPTVTNAIRRAVALAFARHNERLAESAEGELERAELEAAFRELVYSARNDDVALFGDIQVVKDEWMGTYGWLVSMDVQLGVAEGEEVGHLMGILGDTHGYLTKLQMHEGRVVFEAFRLTEEAGQELRSAISRVEDQIQHVRDFRAGQAEAFRRYAAEIQRELGPLPDD